MLAGIENSKTSRSSAAAKFVVSNTPGQHQQITCLHVKARPVFELEIRPPTDDKADLQITLVVVPARLSFHLLPVGTDEGGPGHAICGQVHAKVPVVEERTATFGLDRIVSARDAHPELFRREERRHRRFLLYRWVSILASAVRLRSDKDVLGTRPLVSSRFTVPADRPDRQRRYAAESFHRAPGFRLRAPLQHLLPWL